MTNFNKVAEFNEKFGLGYDGPPRMMPRKVLKDDVMHLSEEFDELLKSIEREGEENKEDFFDALLDIVYKAKGMAYKCGFDWDEGFERVHEKNMEKVFDPNAEGYKSGIVKPEGWEAPNLKELVS